MPLKHWAKLTMLLQSLVSLMIAILVDRAGRSTSSTDDQRLTPRLTWPD